MAVPANDPATAGPSLERGITMLALFAYLQTWIKSEDEGATAVEYGLMVSLIAVVIIAAVTLIGTNLAATFNTVAGSL
jgi:pilus assembly protein Flp/PilA